MLHDLRRTAASGMQRTGARTEVIEKVLNHKGTVFGGIVGTYQRHDFDDAKRRALQAWGDRVERIVKGEVTDDNVVTMRRG